MAKSRGSAPAPDPPADSESESEDSKQPGKSEPTKKPAKAPSVKKPAQAAPPVKKPETPKPSIPDTSSDEEDSGSDSESDSPVKKPIASKPVASKIPNSKANSSLQSLPTKSISAAGAKRPSNSETNGGRDGEGKDAKRLKKKQEKKYVEELEKKGNSNDDSRKKPDEQSEKRENLNNDSRKKPDKESEKRENLNNDSRKKPDGESEKKGNSNDESRKKQDEESGKKGNLNDESRKLFQRLWSEDDEIAILKGMVDYSAKENVDPVAKLDAFHEFIKKSIHVDVSRVQLLDKIRKLKRKYTSNLDKEMKGSEKIFAKDHDRKTFEWSKKVWGKENSTVEKKLETPLKSTRKPKIEVQQVEEVEGNNKEGKISVSEDTRLEEGLKLGNMGLRNWGIEEWIQGNCQFLDEEKRAKMEKKWKDFKIVEGEFYAKKLELMLEETNLLLVALKSSAT